eukprot:Seg16495.2 transcript_id=Seg16495.2/GoldUCD/mRNA.D3Y31 product="hypothetical protein" protein_id=Seg16495.2/GoldUCD/D3Y31
MRDGDKAVFTPFDMFPLEGEDLPVDQVQDKQGNMVDHQYDGWLLMLDEFSSANKQVQAAAYRVVLDREIGSFKLHERCGIVACGNKMADKAVVHKMSTALQSRLIHLELGLDVKEWIKWAMANNIDYRITAFLQYKPASLMNFKPDHKDHTYACPRTWEFVDRLINGEKISREKDLALITGTVGWEAGFDFLTFCEVQKDLPDWADIIDPKMNTKIAPPDEAGAKYATVCWIASKVDEKDVDKVIPYIKQFGSDFQVIWCRGILSRFPNIDRSNQDFIDYSMSMIADIHNI